MKGEKVNDETIVLNQANDQPLTWSSLLTRSYALYWERCGKLFSMALLPSVLAYFWRYAYRFAIRQLIAQGWIATSPYKFPLWIVSGAIDGAFYSVVSSFFFAAVAANVLARPDEEKPMLSDAFSRARTRIGAVAAVGLIFWIVFWLGRVIATFAVWNILDRLHVPVGTLWTIALVLPQLLLVFMLSRLGLAIPALMDDPAVSLKQALQTSFHRTENWELFFTMFLVKSAILGFGLYWLANYALARLWSIGALSPTTYPWARRLIYISIGAVLEAPLFVAFSVLYRDWRAPQTDALSAPAIH